MTTDAKGCDGTAIKLAGLDFGATQTLMDPRYQDGIHDHAMISVFGANGVKYDQTGNSSVNSSANGTTKVHDTVVVTNNSGTYGNLMNIQFLETATGGASFMDRN